jgi:hypothetical protein
VAKVEITNGSQNLLQFGYQWWRASMGSGKAKAGSSLFHNLFVRYGAGFELLVPLTKGKWWNAVAWTSIVLGIAGWAVFLYLVPAG